MPAASESMPTRLDACANSRCVQSKATRAINGKDEQMRIIQIACLLAVAVSPPSLSQVSDENATMERPIIAIIGTGDMGDSLGVRFAELGYSVVYGSRNPQGEKAQNVRELTGNGARVTTQEQAAQAGDIVVLAVPWPAMETVARNLGSLAGKIVIDISFPHQQAADGYYEPMVETSSAEMIQEWNPDARVFKTFALQASYVIDNPDVVDGPVTVPIAGNDRQAKEQLASIIVEMGLDPVDAGPLRLSRELEAMQRLYGVPFFQRREAAWEFYFRRSYYWECIWQDDWSEPVADADDLATILKVVGEPKPCPATD